MIRFSNLRVPEQTYPYEKAVTAAEYKDGVFGTTSAGTFTIGAGFKAIMMVGQGAFADSNLYTIPAGAEVRVADFALIPNDNTEVDITPASYTGTIAKGDKLTANASGILAADTTSPTSYLEVTEVTAWGVRAVVVNGTEEEEEAEDDDALES